MVKAVALKELCDHDWKTQLARRYPNIPKGTVIDVEDRYVENFYGRWFIAHYEGNRYYVSPNEVEIVGPDTLWQGDKASPICPHCGTNVFNEYLYISEICEMEKPFHFCPHCGKEIGPHKYK